MSVCNSTLIRKTPPIRNTDAQAFATNVDHQRPCTNWRGARQRLLPRTSSTTSTGSCHGEREREIDAGDEKGNAFATETEYDIDDHDP